MDNNDLKVLNEIYKGSKMATDGITYMEDKIKDSEFSKEVKKEYDDYTEIIYEVKELLKESGEEPEDTPVKNKIMEWTSIKMNTMADPTISHMAEILIQGTIMGIINGVKILNQNDNLDNRTEKIAHQFVKIGEDNIQILKKYL